MNKILTTSELKEDLREKAVVILWNQSGHCTLDDLLEAGQDESLVAKYGEEAIRAARRIYAAARAA